MKNLNNTGSPEPFNQGHTLGKIARATVPCLGRANADPDGYYRHVVTDEVYKVVELEGSRLTSACTSWIGSGAQYTGVALDGLGWFTNLWIKDGDVHSTPEAAQ